MRTLLDYPLHTLFYNRGRLSLFYLGMFLLFGSIIGTLTFWVVHQDIEHRIEMTLANSAKATSQAKANALQSTLTTLHTTVLAAGESHIFRRFLSQSGTLVDAEDLFFSLANANPMIFQLRYIDAKGSEQIRIDRKHLGSAPFVISADALQNKAHRYYFQKTAKLPEGQLWYSKLDLNIEHGQIEQPIVPTLRIAMPLYHDNRFAGIIIANFFMQPVLSDLAASSIFNIHICDAKGNILIHGQNPSYNWSQYLERDVECPNGSDLAKCGVTKGLESIIPNGEGLRLVLDPKTDVVRQMEQEQHEKLWKIWLLIVLLSVPVAFLLSRFPLKLSEELLITKEKLDDELAIIDRYVLYSATDTAGIITSVSTAFCQLSGYSRHELIGNTHKPVRHPDMPATAYAKMWKTISSGKTWQGELLNRDKSGGSYWLYSVIDTIFDADKTLIGYTSYSENISNKRQLERLAITDDLTGLYNRRHFNDTLPLELKRAQRDQLCFAFLYVDIDYFKQYNDTYGHQAGDKVLRTVGKTLREGLHRPGDYAFRIGGEEFGVIYTATSKEKALAFAYRLQNVIDDLNIEHNASLISNHITISGGLYITDTFEEMDASKIYKAADLALYKAKEQGRNHIVTAEA